MEDNGWKAVFAGICAIIFFSFIAYSFPGMLTGLSNNGGGNLLSGNLRIVGPASSIMFTYGGKEVAWKSGINLVPTCSISSSGTTCLQPSNIANIVSYSPFLILFAILAVIFAILMMILFARKALED